MDWDILFIELIISLVLTIFGYLFIPILLALSGKKYDSKKIKRINTINCIVVWFLFRILQLTISDEASSGVAVFLWGAVGHQILKKYCLEELPANSTPASPPQAEDRPFHICISDEDQVFPKHGNYNIYASDILLQQSTDTPVTLPAEEIHTHKVKPVRISSNTSNTPTKYCSHCGKIVDPTTKKCRGCGMQYPKGIPRKTVLTTLWLILFISSFLGNVFLYFANINLRAEISDLEKANASMNFKIKNLRENIEDITFTKNTYYNYFKKNREKIELLDSNIVFIEDDGSKRYHKYECDNFPGEDYWAHNVEYAKYRGYKPCPECID